MNIKANVLYIDLDLTSEDPDAPYFAGEYKDEVLVSGRYYHSNIVEALKAENEELKAKLSETVIHLAARNSDIKELKAKMEAKKQSDDDDLQFRLDEAIKALQNIKNETDIRALCLYSTIIGGFRYMSDKVIKVNFKATTILNKIRH